jgi:hypothetical protein
VDLTDDSPGDQAYLSSWLLVSQAGLNHNSTAIKVRRCSTFWSKLYELQTKALAYKLFYDMLLLDFFY